MKLHMHSGFSRRATPVVATGAAIALVSLCMMGAWLFQSERIVRLLPGYLMVFNTSLAFFMAGAALVGSAMFPAARLAIQTIAGLATGALGTSVLMQYLLGVDLAVDWVELHRPLIEAAARQSACRSPPA